MAPRHEKGLMIESIIKFSETGIHGVTREGFKSYLSNREQLVEVSGTNNNTREIKTTRSDSIFIKRSIPKGSVLGCTSFLT